MPLKALVAQRRILVCVGSGGVGKTTTAASLALAGALAGRRTLVLTIDPAKRLANALGIDMLGHDLQAVPGAQLAAVARPGVTIGSLDAMMLDQKHAFDEMVARYASDPESERRILGNRIYRQISSSLAGSHEYAAMAKLCDIAEAGRYDLIVLDTPPTANALDFLDAPRRLIEALDSSAMQWFTGASAAAGRVSLKAVGFGAAFVLKRLGKFVGTAFFDDVAEFLAEFNKILGGFRERARQVFSLMRRPEVAFVLVAAPQPGSIDEALFFYDRLVEAKMPFGAFVVNRVHRVAPYTLGRPALLDALAARPELGLLPPDDRVALAAELERGYRQFSVLAEIDQRQVERLRARGGAQAPLVEVPFFDEDIADLPGLRTMFRHLLEESASEAAASAAAPPPRSPPPSP